MMQAAQQLQQDGYRGQSFGQRKKRGRSSSVYVGVTRDRTLRLWKAQIRHKDTIIYLGTHDTEEEAALAFDRMARALRGPRARVNFPETEPFK